MKKILIVDDDADLRLNISEILEDSGFLTDAAATGKEALKKCQDQDFDVILLDMIMPGAKGNEILPELKKCSPKTKIIMITAYATIQSAVDAIQKGASDYIAKPFKIDEFLTTIGRVIEEARFEEEAEKVELDSTLSALSNPIRRKILRLLHSKTIMRLMEITRELEIDDHTKVVFHLKSLKEIGLVEQNREKSYFLTGAGKKMLECLHILENYLSK